MRNYLNNPKFVFPAALLTLLFFLFRIGILDTINLKGYFEKKAVLAMEENKATATFEIEASRIAEAFTKERWMPNNWQQYATLKRELFVADYQLEEDMFSSIELAIKVDPVTGEVEIEEEQLTSYIAENMGLDHTGFFVRFGVIRKREGDDLKTKDGQALTLGKIAIPDQGQLNGNNAYRTVEVVVAGMTLEATSPVEADEAETVAQEMDLVPEVYREGDTITPDLVERKPAQREYASAVILGGVSERAIYREGDLVSRVPAIGLASVSERKVELIDRDGNIYELQLLR
ncbi:MAG: hypothetical protein GWO81_05820 [Verrucomicrobia bacterium]|nr:hypothetical protein [Verrucomicrobiota bacterium]